MHYGLIMGPFYEVLLDGSRWFNSMSFLQLSWIFFLVHDSPVSTQFQVVGGGGIPGYLDHVIAQEEQVCEGRSPQLSGMRLPCS